MMTCFVGLLDMHQRSLGGDTIMINSFHQSIHRDANGNYLR